MFSGAMGTHGCFAYIVAMAHFHRKNGQNGKRGDVRATTGETFSNFATHQYLHAHIYVPNFTLSPPSLSIRFGLTAPGVPQSGEGIDRATPRSTCSLSNLRVFYFTFGGPLSPALRSGGRSAGGRGADALGRGHTKPAGGEVRTAGEIRAVLMYANEERRVICIPWRWTDE